MVNTMPGDLQQKDMQTIDVKCASILTRTLDFRNVENMCNVFLGNVLMDDIVQAMIDSEMNIQLWGRSAFRMYMCQFLGLMICWTSSSNVLRLSLIHI